MKNILRTLCAAAMMVLVGSSFSPAAEWMPLLDKSLSQWEIYLGYRHKNGYQGDPVVDEQGRPVPPIGYGNNTDRVFTMMVEHEQPVLRISGEIYGCLVTRQEYDNYHLKLQVKWGARKWQPRTDKLRDTGIVYHSIGPAGADYWRAWMLGQEFQIMEGHMGDYWNIANSAIDIKAFLPEGSMNAVANAGQPWVSVGTGTGRVGFCLRSENFESPNGEWTDVELICFNGKSIHIVNGHVVMVLQNSRYMDNGKSTPLTKGKIQLQSEGAEAYYKDVRISVLRELPSAYASLF